MIQRKFLQIIIAVVLGISSVLFNTEKVVATPSLTLKWSYTGDTAYGMGFKVGDINCDEVDDLIVSNTYYSSNRGSIDVYYGGQVFDGTYDIRYPGVNASDWLGYMGNAYDVGDFDKDGCDDILIGALGVDENGSASGKVYLIKGAEGLSGVIPLTTATFTGIGNTSDKIYFGCNVKFGDFNGDSLLDVVVVSGVYAPSRLFFFINKNKVFTFNSPDSTITTSGTYYMGNGSYVTDTNSDGYDDYIFPDNTGDTSLRKLYVYRGVPELPTTHSSVFLQEVNADYLGLFGNSYAVSDINSDGKNDICIGAYSNDTYLPNSGRVYCWYIGESIPAEYYASTADFILSGSTVNQSFGRTISFADINNDGIEDLIVGSNESHASPLDHGRINIFLHNGVTINTNPWLSIIRDGTGGKFGNNIISSDFNFNGWKEIIIQEYDLKQIHSYEIAHGTADITIPPNSYLTVKSISGTASEVNVSFTIGGTQWSLTNTIGGIWNDCSADDGAFDGMNEDFTCDLSSLTEGSYTIYFRSHDQDSLYVPEGEYASTTFILDTTDPTGSVSIDAGATYTDTTSVTLTLPATDDLSGISQMKVSEDPLFTGVPWEAYNASKGFTLSGGDGIKTVYVMYQDLATNESIVYDDTITLDQTNPTINITNLGLISNVPDQSYLAYYFTSQTPFIQGMTEPNSTVYYIYGSNTYTTTADGTGHYGISIESPSLPRTWVTLKYYAVDPAGNLSEERTLVLIVGIENFPEPEVTNTPSVTPSVSITITPTITEMPQTGDITPTPILPTIVIYKVEGGDGTLLVGAVVTIDGQEYVSDDKGQIYVQGRPDSNPTVTIEYNGEVLSANISGSNITAGEAISQNTNITYLFLILLMVLLATGGYAVYRYRRNH